MSIHSRSLAAASGSQDLSSAVLTHRIHLDDTPDVVPTSGWAYTDTTNTAIKLATGILILPQHNPVICAKQVATLDYMSGGRVLLGIGVGWLREEFDALGVPFAERGALLLVAPPRGVGRSETYCSVPIPKFVSVCGTVVCELRNRRTLATY